MDRQKLVISWKSLKNMFATCPPPGAIKSVKSAKSLRAVHFITQQSPEHNGEVTGADDVLQSCSTTRSPQPTKLANLAAASGSSPAPAPAPMPTPDTAAERLEKLIASIETVCRGYSATIGALPIYLAALNIYRQRALDLRSSLTPHAAFTYTHARDAHADTDADADLGVGVDGASAMSQVEDLENEWLASEIALTWYGPQRRFFPRRISPSSANPNPNVNGNGNGNGIGKVKGTSPNLKLGISPTSARGGPGERGVSTGLIWKRRLGSGVGAGGAGGAGAGGGGDAEEDAEYQFVVKKDTAYVGLYDE